MAGPGPRPTPQRLEDRSCTGAGLVHCQRDGVRSLGPADGDRLEDLCGLLQTRLRQRRGSGRPQRGRA